MVNRADATRDDALLRKQQEEESFPTVTNSLSLLASLPPGMARAKGFTSFFREAKKRENERGEGRAFSLPGHFLADTLRQRNRREYNADTTTD